MPADPDGDLVRGNPAMGGHVDEDQTGFAVQPELVQPGHEGAAVPVPEDVVGHLVPGAVLPLHPHGYFPGVSFCARAAILAAISRSRPSA